MTRQDAGLGNGTEPAGSVLPGGGPRTRRAERARGGSLRDAEAGRGVVRLWELRCGTDRAWVEGKLGNEGAEWDRAVSEGRVGLDGVPSARAMGSSTDLGRVQEIAVLRWTGGRGLEKEEVGKGGRWICRVKWASLACCQRWYRMCRGRRGTGNLCMESWPQPFAWGEEQIPACSLLAFSSRRDTGTQVSHGCWCQPGGCPGVREQPGGLVQTHISSWDISVHGEPAGFFTVSVAPEL